MHKVFSQISTNSVFELNYIRNTTNNVINIGIFKHKTSAHTPQIKECQIIIVACSLWNNLRFGFLSNLLFIIPSLLTLFDKILSDSLLFLRLNIFAWFKLIDWRCKCSRLEGCVYQMGSLNIYLILSICKTHLKNIFEK